MLQLLPHIIAASRHQRLSRHNADHGVLALVLWVLAALAVLREELNDAPQSPNIDRYCSAVLTRILAHPRRRTCDLPHTSPPAGTPTVRSDIRPMGMPNPACGILCVDALCFGNSLDHSQNSSVPRQDATNSATSDRLTAQWLIQNVGIPSAGPGHRVPHAKRRA